MATKPGQRSWIRVYRKGPKKMPAPLMLPPESHCFGKQPKRLHDPAFWSSEMSGESKVVT